MELPSKRYQVIYADPPWQVQKGGLRKARPNQGCDLDYPVLSLRDIEHLLFEATLLAEPNATLFLWTVDKFLFEAEEIAERLGYKLHARMIWDKENGVAPAFSVRYSHEYLLWLYRGKFQPVETSQRGKWMTVLRERATKHSKKPQIAYELIESLYPNTMRLEMFARAQREGWDVFGNEVEGSISLS